MPLSFSRLDWRKRTSVMVAHGPFQARSPLFLAPSFAKERRNFCGSLPYQGAQLPIAVPGLRGLAPTRPRLSILPLTVIEHCQIVEAVSCIEMLGSQLPLVDLKNPR